MQARAILAHAPSADGKPNLSMSEIEIVLPLHDDELLVELVATGICHTDLIFADMPETVPGMGYPRVLGHEGIGWVRETGSAVKVAKPGDAVSLSFTSCGSCNSCTSKHPAFCKDFPLLNYTTFRPPAFKTTDSSGGKAALHGHFFGQSSFASLSKVVERAVVNVSQWVKDEKDMVDLAPMGCAFQTGAATVENLAGAREGDIVVVMGLGGVGMAGVMAARIQKCKQIIAVDRIPSRLQLAKELGATDTINTSEADLVAEVHRLTNGAGSSITLDATGVQELCQQAVEFAGLRGKLALVGAPAPDKVLQLDHVKVIQGGVCVVGSIEGDAVPSEYVPKMIKWFKEGRFPVDRLVKTYPASDFQTALHDMHTGTTIKPVLLWK